MVKSNVAPVLNQTPRHENISTA